MPRRPPPVLPSRSRQAAILCVALAGGLASTTPARAQSIERDTDRIDITGRQNLTLGSGARAYGMGGAFLARADDATAASWNPAGLSYLRQPELSLVGVGNSFDTSRGPNRDSFRGRAIDFAAFTWPVAIGSAGGAIQLSYQRAVSFDGRRDIDVYDSDGALTTRDRGTSDGGFDVLSLGLGLRLTRWLRAGVTVNRWVSGYEQDLDRTFYGREDNLRPLRQFGLDFRPDGTSLNLGVMWSPAEALNVGAVYKTGFEARLDLDKTRVDPWREGLLIKEVTVNHYRMPAAQLDFPASTGVGVSWRPHDRLTVSADATLTRWSRARIHDYFDLTATRPGSPAPRPNVYPLLQYPTLVSAPEDATVEAPDQLDQQDKQELRAGVEYVLIGGDLKFPLRAGYFSDRQITRDFAGRVPRFNGFTAGAGLGFGSVLLDVAYIYEFGSYRAAADPAAFVPGRGTQAEPTTPPLRTTLTTHRVFASLIYRFSGGR